MNHTEEIHYSEFLAAMVSTRIRVHDNLIREAFRRFDADGSGFIDRNDLKHLVGDSFEGASLETLIKAADTDSDGKVSYDEWISYVMHTREEEHHDAAAQIIDRELSRVDCACFRLQMRRKTIAKAIEQGTDGAGVNDVKLLDASEKPAKDHGN